MLKDEHDGTFAASCAERPTKRTKRAALILLREAASEMRRPHIESTLEARRSSTGHMLRSATLMCFTTYSAALIMLSMVLGDSGLLAAHVRKSLPFVV